MMQFSSITPSDTIALAACVIALLSFITTIVTIAMTRKHNRLSVKPILKIIPKDYENYIAVLIRNAGTGPLLRKKLSCSNGTLQSSSLIDLMPHHDRIKWANFSKFEEYIIPSNEYETLIEIRGDQNNDEFNQYKKEIRKALKDINIYCEYNDIYGNRFKSEEVNLFNCYGRHFK